MSENNNFLQTLYDISLEFTSTLDFDVILGKVLSMTVQALSASEGSIFVLNQAGQVTHSIIARDELPPEVQTGTIHTVMQYGLAGRVYKSRQYCLVVDTEQDDRWHEFDDDRLQTRSALCVPITTQRGQVIGIITLTDPHPNAFKNQHIELLHLIALQAANAIQNAAQYSQTHYELTTLASIMDVVQDDILVFDLEDKLLMANASAMRNFSIQEDYIGMPLAELALEDSLIQFLSKREGNQHSDSMLEISNGRYFSAFLTWVPSLGKVASFHDVTHLKRLDMLKDETVSHVSHDLSNPLLVVNYFADRIIEEASGNQEVITMAEDIKKNVGRMRDLVYNLLDVSKLEMGIEKEFETCEVEQIVSSVVAAMEPIAEQKQVKLLHKCQANHTHVHGSSLRLSQALTNLLDNAIKFTPEDRLVKVSSQVKDGFVEVTVSDNGPGINPDRHDRLFQKFSKLGEPETKENEGYGLGLAIVKSIVDAHQGQVWVESEPGEGSIFTFRIPLLTN